jgi:hypothetical protein
MVEHPALTYLLTSHETFDHAMDRASVQSWWTRRRIAAERAIMAEHAPGSMAVDRDETQCRTCSAPQAGFSGSWPVEYPCRTVILLAEGWGWTEDMETV